MPATPQRLPDGDRRLRALRALLGFSTPDQAVAALGVTMSASTWSDIEQPARPRRLWDYEADLIAEAAGIHPSFFTAPIERLGDIGP